MALEVGAVVARLSAKLDDDAFDRFERRVESVRRDTRRPVEAELRADVDDRGFRRYEQQVDRAERSSKRLGSAGALAARGLTAAAGGAAVAGGGAAILAKQFITSASSIEESTSKIKTVLGSAGDELLKFSETSAKAYGISKQAALEATGTLGALFKNFGQTDKAAAASSVQFAKLAADMASFNNTSPAEAIEALGAGLRGEAEPLRRYGVLLTAAGVQAEAASMGLVKVSKNSLGVRAAQTAADRALKTHNQTVREFGGNSLKASESSIKLEKANVAVAAAMKGGGVELTAQQKALATQNLILKQTTTQQGDFERTSKGMANQSKILQARLKDVGSELGLKLLPFATKVVTKMNKLVDEFKAGEGTGGKLRDTLRELGDALERVWNMGRDAGGFLIRHAETVERIAKAWVAYKVAVEGVKGYGALRRLLSGAGPPGAPGLGGAGGAGVRGQTLATPLYVLDVGDGPGRKVPPVVPAGDPRSPSRGRAPTPTPRGGGPALNQARAPTGLARVGAGLSRAAPLARNLAGGPMGLGATAAYVGFAALLNSQIPTLDKYTARLDRLAAPPGSGNKRGEQIHELTKQMRDAVKAGDPEKLKAVTRELDRLAGSGRDETSRELRAVAKAARDLARDQSLAQVREQLGLTRNNFARLSADGSVSMKEIRQATKANTKRIKQDLGADTEAGRKALANNFREARRAVRESMDGSKGSVKDGLGEIRRLMSAELKTYGLKGTVSTATTKSGASFQVGTGAARGGYIGRAVGGWIGRRGEAGLDNVLIAPGVLAARGEYDAHGPGTRRAVLNRHQQPIAEAALAAGGFPSLDALPSGAQLPILERALQPLGGLSRLFSRVRRPHYLAAGGIVPVPGFPGESASSSILGSIALVARRFGLTLTDAFGPGHQSPGHTVYGTAADFAGPDASMDAAVKYLVGQGYVVGYDGRYGSASWPGHGPAAGQGGSNAHLHVEFGNKGAAGPSAGAASSDASIKRVLTNVPGTLGRITQAGLDIGRAGATEAMRAAIDESLATPVGGGNTGGGAAPPGKVRDWIKAGLELAGHPSTPANINTLYGRVMQESGGDPKAQNNWDSNAAAGIPSKGLVQTIEPTFRAHMVAGHGDIWNPVHNVAAAVRYMLSRYGHLVAASGSGYARGGLFGLAGGGKFPGIGQLGGTTAFTLEDVRAELAAKRAARWARKHPAKAEQGVKGETGAGGALQLPATFKSTHPTGGLAGYPAIDVFGTPGRKVLSPADGRVDRFSEGTYSGPGGPFGLSMYIGSGRRSYYLTHMGSRAVKIGDRVRRGQVIGTIGNYPNASSDHIHMGLRGLARGGYRLLNGGGDNVPKVTSSRPQGRGRRRGRAEAGSGEDRLQIRALGLRAPTKIDDYEDVLASIGDDARLYSQQERRVGFDERELVDEKTGEIDAGALSERIAAYEKLVTIRERILAKLKKARRIIDKVLKTYAKIIRRLKRARNATTKPGKRRKYDAEIAGYQDQRDEWRTTAGGLGYDITDAKMDVREIKAEQSALTAEANEASAAIIEGNKPPPLEPGETGADTGAGETTAPATPADIAAAALAALGQFQAARADLFGGFGANFRGAGAAGAAGGVFAGVGAQAAGTRYLGGETGGTAGGALAGAGGAGVVQNITFTGPAPADPHTFTQAALHELRAAV